MRLFLATFTQNIDDYMILEKKDCCMSVEF